jgi:ribokinase
MSVDVIVIGAVSLDRLHIGAQQYDVPGGAGLYTALGAQAAGARVILVAPKPDPLPAELREIADYLSWQGPRIVPEQLTRLEIVHHGQGKATLLHANWGAVHDFSPADLPTSLQASWIHIAALGPTEKQILFATALAQASSAALSAGTYAKEALGRPEAVRTLFSKCQAAFMNENEAVGLFGGLNDIPVKPDQRLFITRAGQGALILEPEAQAAIPAVAVVERDPTGAGDSFCGAVLASLARGDKPALAAMRGTEIAALNIQVIGPENLLNR